MLIVTSNPDVLGGSLVFDGARVSVRNLFDCLVAGDSIQEFLEDYPTVSFEQVRLLLRSAEIALRIKPHNEAYTVPQIGLAGAQIKSYWTN